MQGRGPRLARMGAERGNSGVILSQLLRGVAEQFAPASQVGPARAGLGCLVTGGGASPTRPWCGRWRGRSSRVAKAAGRGARRACARGRRPRGGAIEGRTRMPKRDALAHTPDQLEVLARAGVVDAGGTGYVLLLDMPAWTVL